MTTSKIPVDLELKKAFQELQIKMVTTKHQLQVSSLQVTSLSRMIQHAALVNKELETIPNNVDCYESIGRMYLHQPKDSLRRCIDKKIERNKEKITKITDNKDYLSKNLKESEKNLRELVLTKQSQ